MKTRTIHFSLFIILRCSRGRWLYAGFCTKGDQERLNPLAIAIYLECTLQHTSPISGKLATFVCDCTGWGLPRAVVTNVTRGLLHRDFTLTPH